MKRLGVVLGLVVAVVALVWLVMRDGRASALHDPAPAVHNATRAADQGEANAIAALRDGDTSSAGRVEADASADEPTQRPVPDGAPFVDVLVVDAATDTPLAGVEVVFGDDSVVEAVARLPDDERKRLTRLQAWRKLGWRARTDGDGVARVHLGAEWTAVIASHGALYGVLALPGSAAGPPERHRLGLLPDRTLTVQVLDADGRAANHVPVTFVRPSVDGGVWRSFDVRETLPPDGIVRFDHLQLRHELRAPDVTTKAADSVWQVRVDVPGLESTATSFDPSAPPTDPVVLRLPPTGSLVVRLHSAGVPLAGAESLRLRLADVPESPMRSVWQRKVMADGWTKFAHVPLGSTFEVEALAAVPKLSLDARRASVSTGPFAGPTQPGQELRREFAIGADRVLVIGRLCDADGQPVDAREVVFDHTIGTWNIEAIVPIDADGRFAVVLEGGSTDGVTLSRGMFRCEVPGRAPVRHVLGERVFARGPNDLGDLRMTEAPLVVAGRIVFPAGVRPFPIHLHVERWTLGLDTGDADAFAFVGSFQTHQKRDGSFVVTGDAIPGRYRLDVSDGRLLPVEPIEFVLGARDLVVAVDPGAVVRSTVVLADEGSPSPRGLHPVLRFGAVVHEINQAGPSGGRWLFEWRPIPRGTHVLEFYVRGFASPVHVVPDVVVPEPDGGDPRLQDIDLRELLSTVRLRSTDPEDRGRTGPGSRQPVAFPMPQALNAVWDGHRFHDGELVLAVPRGRVDLRIAKEGCVPVELRDVVGTVDVTLVPWPEVELTFVGGGALPDGVRIEAQFARAADDADAGYDLFGWGDPMGDRAALLLPPLEARATATGSLRLPVGGRARELTVRLVRGVGDAAVRSRPLAHRTPPIAPDAVHVDVRIAADEWRRALGEVVEVR